MQTPARRVLVVDDEENIRLVLGTLLKKHGYEVALAATGEEALSLLPSVRPSYVLADVRMPGLGGLELCRRIADGDQAATVIVMSAYGSVDLALEAIRAGAYDYVSKPFQNEEILIVLAKAEERLNLRAENAALRAAAARDGAMLGGLLGQSAAIRDVLRTVQKVAEYRTTVLIQGESGTGKELIARALHDNSPRRDKAFVAVNCGAIPETLMESELFGHKRGAFTDAISDKPGIFQEADGGTLFLDEVGEISPPLQVKLLRVLQEGTFRPVGGKDVQVDVRMIAATVRDLAHEVKEGRFREDLYYRLNVLQIVVPPLRDRLDDIPLLVDHFIERNNERLGTRITGIEPRARRVLLGYQWPGNVRELENLVERAAVLCEGKEITLSDLPARLQQAPDAVAGVLASGELSIKKAERIIEESLIRRALEKTGGNRTAAARLLEISHRALLYKIKEYGVA